MTPMRMSRSDLPDNAIAEILSHLPTKDADRTSILSRSWCHRWQHCPSLDVSGVSAAEISTVFLLHSGLVRLFKAEEELLLLHNASGLQHRWRHHDIHGWLTVSVLSWHSTSTLQTLILSFRISFNIEKMALLNVGHIARDFPNLVHLYLSCTLNVPLQFRRFAALRSLHIHKFQHSTLDRRHVSRLISACPLRETLAMMNVCGWQYLDIDIVDPALRLLELFNLRLTDFSITSAPFLEVASIRLCMFVVDGRGGDSDNGDGDDGVIEDGVSDSEDDVSDNEDVGIGGSDNGDGDDGVIEDDVSDSKDADNGSSDNEDVSGGGNGAGSKNINLLKVFQSGFHKEA